MLWVLGTSALNPSHLQTGWRVPELSQDAPAVTWVLCPAGSVAVQSFSCRYFTVPHTQGPPVLQSLVLSTFRVDDTFLAVAKVGANAYCWGPRGKAFSPGLWEGPVGIGGIPTCGLILTRCQWGSDRP